MLHLVPIEQVILNRYVKFIETPHCQQSRDSPVDFLLDILNFLCFLSETVSAQKRKRQNQNRSSEDGPANATISSFLNDCSFDSDPQRSKMVKILLRDDNVLYLLDNLLRSPLNKENGLIRVIGGREKRVLKIGVAEEMGHIYL